MPEIVDVTKSHTSFWVGLWVPLETAKSIALPSGWLQNAEPPEELHLTLAMCGEVAVMGEEAAQAALDAIKVYAKGAKPMEGSISGTGRFAGGETDVIYASYDAPDLPEFRQSLVEALAHVGVAVSKDHGFSPHITLAYVETGKGANVFPLGIVPDPIPIRFESLRVGVGGTYHEFPLEGKAVEKAAWSTEFEIKKMDDEKRFVFGWANIAIRADGEQIEDYQKDIIDPEDLELAGYDFVLNSRETGEMHQGGAKGHMIESFVVTAEKLQKMGLAPDALPQGWWIGFFVPDDDAWAKVRDGTYQMFSIQGSAVREEVA